MWAFDGWAVVRVKKMFIWLCGIVIVWDEIFDDGQVSKLEALAPPFTYAMQQPLVFNMQILAAPTLKWMSTIWWGVYPNIQEIVVKQLQKPFGSLNCTIEWEIRRIYMIQEGLPKAGWLLQFDCLKQTFRISSQLWFWKLWSTQQ
jgi:hypothetical protein